MHRAGGALRLSPLVAVTHSGLAKWPAFRERLRARAALLRAAGADPDDGESLDHSLDRPECTRLLLEAGARVTGSNAMYRVLDLDDVTTLKLLLAHGADANEPPPGTPTPDWNSPLMWAIRRRRSAARVAALPAAGADPRTRASDGSSAINTARTGGPRTASATTPSARCRGHRSTSLP